MKVFDDELTERISHWMSQARFWYAMLACYMLVLSFLSLNPWILPTSTESIFSPDKLDHAVAYGGLSIIIFSCLTRSRWEYVTNTARASMVSLAISTLIGILIEITQSLFTTNRIGSVGDAVAKAIVAGIGYLEFHAVKYAHAKIVG